MATKQAENRAKYRNMTAAETIRNMSDAELDRNARKGGRDAILEQAYRHSLQGRSMIHEPIIPELDEFEAAIRGEAESETERDRRLDKLLAEIRTPELDIGV